jgi:HlyD family secretion protein
MRQRTAASRSIRRHVLLGAILIALLFAGVGSWAATAKLAGAVVATGSVVVEGNIKQVQHRDGGIIGAINVRNGDYVEAGDVVVRLDDTLPRANLAIVEKQLGDLQARRMRLIAERDGLEALGSPVEGIDGTSLLATADLIAAQSALFTARRATLDGEKKLLAERKLQTGKEIEGLQARVKAKIDELDLIGKELSGIAALYEKGLVPMPRLVALQRQKASLDGEKGQLQAEVARAQTRIAETDLQILQLEKDRRAEVLTELRDVDGKLAELEERRIAAADQLRRVEIYAPYDGFVHQLAVFTVGGVIGPGETIMSIVPKQDALIVETRVRPADIDQIYVDQIATLRFSAFNQRTTPELFGKLATISADLSQNQQTGEQWYTVRIRISFEELKRLRGLSLVPGMPVEAFIQTQERTALSYLVKPLTDQIARALREE